MSDFFFTVIGKDGVERRVNIGKIDADDFNTISLTEGKDTCDHIEIGSEQLIELGILLVAVAVGKTPFAFDAESIAELLEGYDPESTVFVLQALREISNTLVVYANTTPILNSVLGSEHATPTDRNNQG